MRAFRAAIVALALLVASAAAQNDFAAVGALSNTWTNLNTVWQGSCPSACENWPYLTWDAPSPNSKFVTELYASRSPRSRLIVF